jgi:hypothetical protein
MTLVQRRLSASAAQPEMMAPITAPTSSEATIHCCANWPACRSFLRNSRAPEITPVS